MDEMEECERERLKDCCAAITLARNPEQVKEEIGELNELAEHATRRGSGARRSCPDSRT